MQTLTIPHPTDAAVNPPVAVDARDLITHGATAAIILDDQTYTLRITRAGGLILTK